MEKHKTQDQRIKELMKESWLAAFYFTLGIDALRRHIAELSDEEIYNYFGRIIAPEQAKEHIKYMYNELNCITDEQTTAPTEGTLSEPKTNVSANGIGEQGA